MASVHNWDYLIVTAGNDAQAAAYEAQLRERMQLGLLAGAGEALVVADPMGRRVGSGGSTIWCLMALLGRRLGSAAADRARWLEELRRLRVLIIHGGGDSRRLAAYGPCGKVFVPMPGPRDSALPLTLLDRQLPTYLALPAGCSGVGQFVIASGDVLLLFDPAAVRLDRPGLTGLAAPAPPDLAARHGVYCASSDGGVGLFLQKPTPEQQQRCGAIGPDGRAMLDIGVMSFDADFAAALLGLVGPQGSADGRLAWGGPVAAAIESCGLDFYREICCAMGLQASRERLAESAAAAGSGCSEAALGEIFQAVSPAPFNVQVLEECTFLHFGTTGQLISSGLHLLARSGAATPVEHRLMMCSTTGPRGRLSGGPAWVEGCRIDAVVELAGDNALIGVDVPTPLHLPPQACLDVAAGADRQGKPAWFVRCYALGDDFKRTLDGGATFCGRPLAQWLTAVGATEADIFPASPGERTLWQARLFPAAAQPQAWGNWLWMFQPDNATAQQKQAYLEADRYSLAEMALQIDSAAFHQRRRQLHVEQLRGAVGRLFDSDSTLSATDLIFAWRCCDDCTGWVLDILDHARLMQKQRHSPPAVSWLDFGQGLHKLATAVEGLPGDASVPIARVLPGLGSRASIELRQWLAQMSLAPVATTSVREWSAQLRRAAFEDLGLAIISSRPPLPPPRCAIAKGQTVVAQAPARLDLAGGWTDTPPYSLQRGGRVINAAVTLEGRMPIRVQLRLTDEPVITLSSLDQGTTLRIATREELLDYRDPACEFSLAKAALALSGFAPQGAGGATLQGMLESFGGGIELQTHSAVPKGSGLGTSSIVGSALLAALARMQGRPLERRELFHQVLCLEQAMTAGGGWQDQIGGGVEGVKLISTEPGLVSDPHIRPLPADALDPQSNGGLTLLYYTGITRLARNILQEVVEGWMNRDRRVAATLEQIRALTGPMAAALEERHLPRLGQLIGQAWRLNKQLDAHAANDEIEDLLSRVEPHVHGAKLLGAGGGGFLLMVCKSSEDATRACGLLSDPRQPQRRCYDFQVSRQGLTVSLI
ncbi:MAG: hypothetical protein LLG01_09400 [Planctomycetaceae bacterium]|nr:hypothetical protein [Planctomycetaceae bacterium]